MKNKDDTFVKMENVIKLNAYNIDISVFSFARCTVFDFIYC